MRVALDIFGVLFFLAGIGRWAISLTEVGQLSALLLILIGAVFLVGAAIVLTIQKTWQPPD